jgi:GntR family transcriptional repressor for pyruvate dehydrogenase complex
MQVGRSVRSSVVGPMNEIFSPIRQRKISEEIADQLKSTIFTGKLKPGQKLPPERELAKSMNVSRVSLREALNTLQGMGLLEIQRGNRTFVRPITTRSIHDPLVTFCKSSPQSILQVLELRKYLEIGAASLAAERASAEHVGILEKILAEMEEDFKKNRLGAMADLSFHHTIVEATHNQAFIHTLTTIYDLLQEELRIAWGGVFKKKDSRRKLLEQHQKMYHAIRDRAPQKAAEETQLHLTFVEKEWRDALKAQGGWEGEEPFPKRSS